MVSAYSGIAFAVGGRFSMANNPAGFPATGADKRLAELCLGRARETGQSIDVGGHVCPNGPRAPVHRAVIKDPHWHEHSAVRLCAPNIHHGPWSPWH